MLRSPPNIFFRSMPIRYDRGDRITAQLCYVVHEIDYQLYEVDGYLFQHCLQPRAYPFGWSDERRMARGHPLQVRFTDLLAWQVYPGVHPLFVARYEVWLISTTSSTPQGWTNDRQRQLQQLVWSSWQ